MIYCNIIYYDILYYTILYYTMPFQSTEDTVIGVNKNG